MYRWLFFDVDGVLTDGRIWINEDGLGSKCMNMKDIDAINELIGLGCRLVAITAEKNSFTNYVKNKFSWTCFKDGVSDKLDTLIGVVKDNDISLNDIVYIGDGKKDLPLFCGKWFTICPADAIMPIKQKADKVLSGVAGSGALWEIVDWICELKPVLHENTDQTTSNAVLFKEELNCSFSEHISLLKSMDSDDLLKNDIVLSGRMIVNALINKNKVFIFGNGGSAADAQHIAAEFMGKYNLYREPWNVIALTTNSSLVTAVANDYDYSQIFRRQVEAMVGNRDVVIGLSTGGKSKNVLLALQKAHEIGANTIFLSGASSSETNVDITINVPSTKTPRIQEAHILIGHYWASVAEKYICGEVK